MACTTQLSLEGTFFFFLFLCLWSPTYIKRSQAYSLLLPNLFYCYCLSCPLSDVAQINKTNFMHYRPLHLVHHELAGTFQITSRGHPDQEAPPKPRPRWPSPRLRAASSCHGEHHALCHCLTSTSYSNLKKSGHIKHFHFIHQCSSVQQFFTSRKS